MKNSLFLKILAVGLGFALAISGSVWAFKNLRRDPQWAKVQSLREDLRSEDTKELPADERRGKWKEYFQEVQKLTPEQRDKLFQERERQREKEIADYFALAREEQVKHLDAQVDREAEMRKRWEKSRVERAAAKAQEAKNQENAGGGQGEPAAQGSEAQPGQGPGQGQNQGPGQGQRNGPPGFANMTPQERDQRRRAYLDSTTPEARAQRAEYSRQMQERRKERGLPPSGGRGPR